MLDSLLGSSLTGNSARSACGMWSINLFQLLALGATISLRPASIALSNHIPVHLLHSSENPGILLTNATWRKQLRDMGERKRNKIG